MPREATRDDIVRAGIAGVKMHLRRGEPARAAFYLGMAWTYITPQTDAKLQAEADDLRARILGADGRAAGILDVRHWPGLSKNHRVKDFDPRALEEGVRVEMEHTGGARVVAKHIAMDHLVEDPSYYRKLRKIEGRVAGVKVQKFGVVDVQPGRFPGDFVVFVNTEAGGSATVRVSPSRVSRTGFSITSTTAPLSAKQEIVVEKAAAKAAGR